MDAATVSSVLFLSLAIVLEVIANTCLKYSNGFKNRYLGICSIILILGAFTALSIAVKEIDLSIAYTIWGGFGILATIAIGYILFNQRLKVSGWFGVILLIIGMALLKFS